MCCLESIGSGDLAHVAPAVHLAAQLLPLPLLLLQSKYPLSVISVMRRSLLATIMSQNHLILLVQVQQLLNSLVTDTEIAEMELKVSLASQSDAQRITTW
jgi:hypothetical protein